MSASLIMRSPMASVISLPYYPTCPCPCGCSDDLLPLRLSRLAISPACSIPLLPPSLGDFRFGSSPWGAAYVVKCPLLIQEYQNLRICQQHESAIWIHYFGHDDIPLESTTSHMPSFWSRLTWCCQCLRIHGNNRAPMTPSNITIRKISNSQCAGSRSNVQKVSCISPPFLRCRSASCPAP